MAKFNLEDAMDQVYSKAEEMYKNSEITSDIIESIANRYFSKKYSPRQIELIVDYYKEQEAIYDEMLPDDYYVEEDEEVFEEMKCLKEDENVTLESILNNIDNLKSQYNDNEGISKCLDEIKTQIKKCLKEDTKTLEEDTKNDLVRDLNIADKIISLLQDKFNVVVTGGITLSGIYEFKVVGPVMEIINVMEYMKEMENKYKDTLSISRKDGDTEEPGEKQLIYTIKKL